MFITYTYSPGSWRIHQGGEEQYFLEEIEKKHRLNR